MKGDRGEGKKPGSEMKGSFSREGQVTRQSRKLTYLRVWSSLPLTAKQEGHHLNIMAFLPPRCTQFLLL